MATTTNFGWETPDDTDLVKDGAAAIRTALGGVDTSFVDLKGGTTGQVLSKATNTDLDFTWVAQDDSNAIQNAIVDAKGDLITATAADTPARLAVGTNGQTLVADSSTATGLKWATSGWPTAVGCSVYNAGSNVTYTANVPLIQNFTLENYDTNTMHDNSTNTSRITIPTGYAGKYLINGFARLASGVDYSLLRVYQNGSAVTNGLESGELVRGYHAGNTTGINGSVTLNLAVNDYIELAIQTSVGGAISTYCRFSVSYLGA